MSTASDPSSRQIPPNLADLFNRYLQEQAMAHQAGLGFADWGDVTPYDAVAAQPIDPRIAWEGAGACLRYLMSEKDLQSWKVPADWPALVASLEATMLLPFCVGNFPQLVRDLPNLFTAATLNAPQASSSANPSAGLVAWAENTSPKGPNPLLAAAALRLAGQFDRAAKLLEQAEKTLPETCQAAVLNEKAALAWHKGETEEATRLWESQAPSAPVLFNRGLAALFAGRRDAARKNLKQAVAQIPESDPWHHLGQLYYALAELRG